MRLARTLLLESGNESVFDVAFLDREDLDPLRRSLEELGYRAEIIPPDRLRICLL